MKILLLGDIHFGVRSDNIAFHDANKMFFDNVLFPYIKKHKIKTVVQLGDLFDRRKYINYVSLNRARNDFIDPILKLGVDLHLIAGNHDTYFKSTNEINAQSELLSNYNVNIYASPTEVKFENTKILMLPWICDDNREESLELIGKTNAKICFGHLELQGFEMYRGSLMSHGDDPKTFSKFDIVCSGHYHHRSNRDNIHYLGSNGYFTWSDYNDPRGFHVLDTKTLELEFVKNPYDMFYKFWYNDSEEGFLDNVDYTIFTSKIVKIIIQEKNNSFLFDNFIDKIENNNPIELQIVEDHLNLDIESDEDIISETESTLDIFRQYVSNLEINNIDRGTLERNIVNLYQEALSIE